MHRCARSPSAHVLRVAAPAPRARRLPCLPARRGRRRSRPARRQHVRSPAPNDCPSGLAPAPAANAIRARPPGCGFRPARHRSPPIPPSCGVAPASPAIHPASSSAMHTPAARDARGIAPDPHPPARDRRSQPRACDGWRRIPVRDRRYRPASGRARVRARAPQFVHPSAGAAVAGCGARAPVRSGSSRYAAPG